MKGNIAAVWNGNEQKASLEIDLVLSQFRPRYFLPDLEGVHGFGVHSSHFFPLAQSPTGLLNQKYVESATLLHRLARSTNCHLYLQASLLFLADAELPRAKNRRVGALNATHHLSKSRRSGFEP